MLRLLKAAIPVTLLVAAISLSACASKPEAVAEPSPVTVVAENPIAPEATPEPAATPVVIAGQPVVSAESVPKPVIRKAKKIATKSAPVNAPQAKAPPPPPTIVPDPIVQQVAPLPPEPSPLAVIAPSVEKVAEAGFMERYWIWLTGLIIVIAGTVVWQWMSRGEEH